jgi:predicted Zn-dependent protease with MMP-like domain
VKSVRLDSDRETIVVPGVIQPKGDSLYRRRFERLVIRALTTLPESIRDMIDNVAIVVEDEPSPDHLVAGGIGSDDTLLGLYQGIPLTERTASYNMVLPDRISIFQRPIEEMCGSDQEIMYQVRRTVVHELAHHFGMEEWELRRLRR